MLYSYDRRYSAVNLQRTGVLAKKRLSELRKLHQMAKQYKPKGWRFNDKDRTFLERIIKKLEALKQKTLRYADTVLKYPSLEETTESNLHTSLSGLRTMPFLSRKEEPFLLEYIQNLLGNTAQTEAAIVDVATAIERGDTNFTSEMSQVRKWDSIEGV